MMETVREWVISVVTVTVLLSAAETLLPEGTLRKIGSFTGGLLLLFTVLQPLPGVDFGGIGEAWEAAEAAVEEQRQMLAEEEKTELAAGIEARTAAYISEQAAQMGVAITASVETKVDGNGIPVPWEATLEGENSPVLAERIERELGIPQERQVWKCED